MKPNSIALIVVLLASFCACDFALAQKKGGGKGGGGEDPEPTGPLLVELDTTEGLVLDINELNTIVDETTGDIVWEGVEAVGRIAPSAESAMYWRIDGNGTVEETIALPTAAPPNHEAAYSNAAGINSKSVIVGYGFEVKGEPAEWPCWPLLWSRPSANAFLLPVPTGFSGGQAWHVNDDGIAIGYVWNDTECCVIAWKIDVSGVTPVVEDHVTFLTGSRYYPWLTNRARVAQSGIGVANVKDPDDDELDAYRFQLLWDGLELKVTPGTIEPLFNELSWSIALDVNDSGWVSGEFALGVGVDDEAFVIDDTGHLVTLETLPPERRRGERVQYANEWPMAINNYGVSVGSIWPSPYVVSTQAAIWDADGALSLLPEYWKYSNDINDAGWIGGESILSTPAVLIPQQ